MISVQPKASFRRLTIESAEQAVSLYFAPIHQVLDGLALMVKEPFVIKRALDITISMFLLLVFSPLLLVVALLIKLTTRGPVFFKQERLGLNRQQFWLYKFRTLKAPTAKELEYYSKLGLVPVFDNGLRVTPIGRYLLRTSLDELPQLYNVLKGDMSLVGTRPLPLGDYEGFDQDWQHRRFSVRPGMASLGPTKGGELSFAEWARLADEYMDGWSLLRDAKILARSLSAVLHDALSPSY